MLNNCLDRKEKYTDRSTPLGAIFNLDDAFAVTAARQIAAKTAAPGSAKRTAFFLKASILPAWRQLTLLVHVTKSQIRSFPRKSQCGWTGSRKRTRQELYRGEDKREADQG